mgnify:CR=1 FL=1|jgi:hypothetical protein
MKLFNSLHLGEGVRIAMIVILIYATIAIVTYLAW